ncbi:hypothetical protein M9458_023818, partial [Cirrhinus mrigala]
SDDFFEPSTPTSRRLLRKGAVPTLFMGSDSSSTSAPKRFGLWKKRRVSALKQDPEPKELQHNEHDYCSSVVQDDLVLDQTEDLRKERFCLGRFAASDDDISFYT